MADESSISQRNTIQPGPNERGQLQDLGDKTYIVVHPDKAVRAAAMITDSFKARGIPVAVNAHDVELDGRRAVALSSGTEGVHLGRSEHDRLSSGGVPNVIASSMGGAHARTMAALGRSEVLAHLGLPPPTPRPIIAPTVERPPASGAARPAEEKVFPVRPGVGPQAARVGTAIGLGLLGVGAAYLAERLKAHQDDGASRITADREEKVGPRAPAGPAP